MRIGVPKDIKVAERRGGLTLAGARDCVAHGHAVLVEAGAGAEIIIKVKKPQPAEWTRLRPSQVLFAYLHLAPDRAQAEGLPASDAIASGRSPRPKAACPLSCRTRACLSTACVLMRRMAAASPASAAWASGQAGRRQRVGPRL